MTRSVLAFPHEAERAGGLRGMEHLAARDASGRSQDYAYMPSALREKSRKVTFGNSVLMIDNSTKVILDGFETKHVTG